MTLDEGAARRYNASMAEERVMQLRVSRTRRMPEKGRDCVVYFVTLPAECLAELGWRGRDNILFTQQGDKLILEKIPPETAEAMLATYRQVAHQRLLAKKRISRILKSGKRSPS